MTNLRWSSWGAVCACVVLVVGLSALAFAAGTPVRTAKINACAKKRGGALRIAKQCRGSERRVRWGKAGPQGAAGATGAAGAAGATGPAGTAGANGTNGVNGTNGTNGVDGTTTGQTFYAESIAAGSNFGGGACGTPTGPSVTFTAPAGAYVQVMAQADMQRSSATANTVCLQIDAGTAYSFLASTSLAYETRYSSQSVAGGATDVHQAQPFAIPLSAGSHTISLSYSSTGGTSNFKNRKLWVTLLKPAS